MGSETSAMADKNNPGGLGIHLFKACSQSPSMAVLPSGSSSRILIPPSALGSGGCKMQAFQEQSQNRVISAETAEAVSMGGAGKGTPVPPPSERQCIQLSAGQVGGVWSRGESISLLSLFFSIKVWLIDNSISFRYTT